MFKTWREEYRANQAQKRKIELEEWEQKKRWAEEDRAARQKVIAENTPALEAHNEKVKTAIGVSYLTLVCHEDTWTFMAIRAFGTWKPTWVQSTTAPYGSVLGPGPAERMKLTVDPNLPEGRIKKQGASVFTEGPGMQEVMLSGHNLGQLLSGLYKGVGEDDVAASARCSRLYDKLVEFVDLVDPEAEAGRTTGIRFHIDDSVDAARVAK